jgi:D-alanyl-D-alanine-carboxypeptidase/D-alanyl-D-alanine-endopeptidase
MKHFILLLIAIFAFSFGNAQNRRLEKQVSKYIEYEVNLNETPGIIIGIINGDSVYVYSFGEMTKGKPEQLTDSTMFDIGSMTKVFTASLLQILVDEGKIDYEKTLVDYLDKEKLNPSLHNITIRKLATHTSGLPRLPTNFSEQDKDPNNPFAHYRNTDFDIFLKDFNLFTTSSYLYSHVNYALIERVIESVENQSFETVMNEKMLQPLGLNNTTYELTKLQHDRLSTGYLLTGETAPETLFNSFYGAVGLKSEMNDLIKFVQYNLKVGAESELQNSLLKTHEFQVNTGIKKYIDTGIGWHIVRPKRRFYNVISHRGTAVGHQAYIAFVPETKTGVIVLANSRNSLEGFGYFMLKMINNNWKRKG